MQTMETFTRGLDPCKSQDFDSMKRDMEAYFKAPIQGNDYYALSVCAARDPAVPVVLHILHGIRKFHVHLRKYIQWAKEYDEVKGKPTERSVLLGKNRTKYTFPAERWYALYFFHPDMRDQWSSLEYVPRSPDIMSWSPTAIEWKRPTNHQDSSMAYISSEEEDYDFDTTGMGWGDIQFEIEYRKEQRIKRMKKKKKGKRG